MEQPQGFIVNRQEEKVCKLVKSLYDLKQASKQWHEKFNKVMLLNKFKMNKVDRCVYVRNMDKGYVIGYLYVENIYFR
jgi:hypothetical protein